MIQATICLLRREGQILLAMKKRGFGVDKWNGVGGKQQDNEDIDITAVREAEEEIKVKINPQNLEKIATFKFYFPYKPEWDIKVHFYFCYKWEGDPEETEEMKPQWFDLDKIPYEEMWVDDIHWLPRALKGEKLKGEFYFNKNTNKKYRDEYSEFLVENFVTIKDAFQSGFKAKQIFITEEFLSSQTRSRSAGEKNKAEIEKMSAGETRLIDEQINQSFSELKTTSGICAVYNKLNNKIDLEKPIIYLNAINNPGNLGTILRSALAFDLKNIVLDENCVDLYNYKVINASKDAIFKLNIGIDKDLELLKNIKEKMKIFSTRLENSNDLDILKKEKVFCLVLGSESHGVSKKIQDLSDNFIKINMASDIESLNVAGAAAIIFNQIYNK